MGRARAGGAEHRTDRFETDRKFWAPLVPELSVSDLGESLRFRRDTLGFRERFERPEARFAFLEMGRARIMLHQPSDDPDAMRRTAPLEPPLGRGVNFRIEVRDVRTLHDHVRGAGHPLFRPLATAWSREGDHENGQGRFPVQDPDGYLLRFLQHLGRRPVDGDGARS